MKQKYYLALLLVSLSWLIFTVSPPWISVSFDVQGLPRHSEFCGYGFVFAPPTLHFGSLSELHIDFVRLSLKYLASFLLIAVIASKWNKPLVLSHTLRSSHVKASLVGISLLALFASFLIIKEDAQNQLHIAVSSKTLETMAFGSAL